MSALVLMREIAHALPADAVVVNESVTAGGTLRAWLNSRSKRASSRPKEAGSGLACPPSWASSWRYRSARWWALSARAAPCTPSRGLWTAAHYDLPVVFVICNNAQYRILKSGLLAFRSEPAKQGKFVGMDLVQPEIDFVGLAESLGVTAERVSKAQDVGPALKQALSRHGPSLIDIPIDRSVRALF